MRKALGSNPSVSMLLMQGSMLLSSVLGYSQVPCLAACALGSVAGGKRPGHSPQRHSVSTCSAGARPDSDVFKAARLDPAGFPERPRAHHGGAVRQSGKSHGPWWVPWLPERARVLEKSFRENGERGFYGDASAHDHGNHGAQRPRAISAARDDVCERNQVRFPWGASRRGAPRWRGKAPTCLLYTSPSPRDKRQSRMPSSA